jgi:hypothetical protein
MSTSEKQNLLTNRINDLTMIDAHNSLGGKSPSYSNKDSYYTMADFLLWKAEEDGLEYVVYLTPLDSSSLSFSGKDYAPKFNWGKGFRVGAGYRFGMHDNWDLDVIWTWFYNKAKSSITSPEPDPSFEPNVMHPTWGGPVFTDISGGVSLTSQAIYGKGSWALHYNVGDIELGRHYFISKALSLRPCIGLRAAWINQDYSVHYIRVIRYALAGVQFAQLAPASFFADNDFHGLGPRLNLDLQWHFSCHWSVLGKISGSLLYGPFKNRQTLNTHLLTEFHGVAAFPSLIFTEKSKFNRFQTNLEAALGLQWESDFQRVRHFSLGVFYELTEWFRQNRLVHASTTSDGNFANTTAPGITSTPYVKEHGNLGLHGLTFKARLDY